MNIVIINANPRSNGSITKILHLMEQELSIREDISVQFLNYAPLIGVAHMRNKYFTYGKS